MEINYERKIGIKELGKYTLKPYLSLSDNIIGDEIKDAGHYIKKSITEFHLIINGVYTYPCRRKGVNNIDTKLVKECNLQVRDTIRIHFDPDCKQQPFPIYIEISEEKYEVFDKMVKKGKRTHQEIF